MEVRLASMVGDDFVVASQLIPIRQLPRPGRHLHDCSESGEFHTLYPLPVALKILAIELMTEHRALRAHAGQIFTHS